MTMVHIVTYEVDGSRFVNAFATHDEACNQIRIVIRDLLKASGEVADWDPMTLEPWEFDDAWNDVRKDSLDALWLDHAVLGSTGWQAIRLKRIGDFYEAFDDDANTVSKALGITLTKNREGRPMCGIPVHAAEEWLKQLRRQLLYVVTEG